MSGLEHRICGKQRPDFRGARLIVLAVNGYLQHRLPKGVVKTQVDLGQRKRLAVPVSRTRDNRNEVLVAIENAGFPPQ